MHQPRQSRLPLFALLLGALLCLPAQAQWKWRDAGGKIQYSDMPPPNSVQDRDILQRPAGQTRIVVAPIPTPGSVPAAASAPERPASRPDPGLAAKQKAEQELQQQKQKEEQRRVAEAKAENCRNARSQLQTLESGIRMTRTDNKGEMSYLDDKQRADEARRMRDIIASDCR